MNALSKSWSSFNSKGNDDYFWVFTVCDVLFSFLPAHACTDSAPLALYFWKAKRRTGQGGPNHGHANAYDAAGRILQPGIPAEKQVTVGDFYTSSSPVPMKQHLKRAKSSSKILKSLEWSLSVGAGIMQLSAGPRNTAVNTMIWQLVQVASSFFIFKFLE